MVRLLWRFPRWLAVDLSPSMLAEARARGRTGERFQPLCADAERLPLADAGLGIDPAASPQAVSGGDISAAWRLETNDGAVFLKTGPASSYDMFSAEAEGLVELAAPRVLRVPEILAFGFDDDTAFVALEWLQFDRPTRDTEHKLGEQLAALHRTTKSTLPPVGGPTWRRQY